MADTETAAITPQKPIVLRILIGVAYLAAVVGIFWGILKVTELLFLVGIKPAVLKIVYGWLGFPRHDPLGNTISFFLAINTKVFILLTALVYVVGFVRTYFSPQRTRKLLVGKHEFAGNILAALLGVPTPFCTCSAVSLFIGFIEAGVPLGVTLSFLISAPMVNELALGMLIASPAFGWQIAAVYAGCGLLIAIVAGWIIGRLNPRNLVEDWVYDIQVGTYEATDDNLTIKDRVHSAWENLKDIMRRIWLFVCLGIAAAAVITGFVPDDAFTTILGGTKWWSVPLAVLIGVPMYGNAGGGVPIMESLLDKGASMGTALGFLMGMVGLSLPEMIVLRKVLKMKMIVIFVSVVTVGIMMVAYLFNYMPSYVGSYSAEDGALIITLKATGEGYTNVGMDGEEGPVKWRKEGDHIVFSPDSETPPVSAKLGSDRKSLIVTQEQGTTVFTRH